MKQNGSKDGTTKSAKNKVIDGNAVLSNVLNVDDLTDDERRDMLTNILTVIQNQKNSSNEVESDMEVSTSSTTTKSTKSGRKKNKKSSNTKFLSSTKAKNVRIVSSLDELSKDSSSTDSVGNSPIYVVLLPQNKKK